MDFDFLIYGGLVGGGVMLSYVFVFVLDICALPAERRRRLNLAAARESTERLRKQVFDILFPEKKHKEQERDIETDSGEETNDDTCAICLEPFQFDDSVVKGFDCHHEFHRSCVTSWLEKRSDCPTCREKMYTDEAFHTAKLKVLKQNPGAVEEELNTSIPPLDCFQQIEEGRTVDEPNSNNDRELRASEESGIQGGRGRNQETDANANNTVEARQGNRRNNRRGSESSLQPGNASANVDDNNVYQC
mmetsp:Transcript_28025/g.41386  ORF Transcript_28025/g.41386 Transcript_28025/m.41386 type:complete len:247 (-) Transcript_28025:1899-2639(-)|eukprot:CAMPEP_0194205472 /NCGR_PEP_ID=MMETSP0156-20130528/4727_1 /TAXON_ID=33649 /ORGANISM="Thalassionema nitzschioides, Strain L26-B" /LENGTH=246 /DNA_ID=CAMNT_0038931743 /DNA_START=329 /DNA_END=1069 /DNA_ORIENTATION=+